MTSDEGPPRVVFVVGGLGPVGCCLCVAALERGDVVVCYDQLVQEAEEECVLQRMFTPSLV